MKYVFWIPAFIILTVLLDRLGGLGLQRLTEKSGFRYSREYCDSSKHDIVFIGNSRGLTFYQPEVEKLTGTRTINLSYNALPADLAKVLVMDYLDRRPAPKLLIMDITLCDRVNDALIAGFNLYTPYSERLSRLISHYDTEVDSLGRQHNAVGGKISHLYLYNSEIFQRAFYYRNHTDEDWLLDRVISEKMATDTALKSYQIAMFPNMVQELKETIDYAHAKGVEVKLVINPYFPQFQKTIKARFLTPLKEAVQTATGLEVHDYSTAVIETDFFGDYQHLNKNGSVKYMGILFNDGIFSLKPTTFITEPASPQVEVMDTAIVTKKELKEADNKIIKTIYWSQPEKVSAVQQTSVKLHLKCFHNKINSVQVWESVDTFSLQKH